MPVFISSKILRYEFLISLVAYWFGLSNFEFRIPICFDFCNCISLKKTNIQNAKFNTSKLMSYQGHNSWNFNIWHWWNYVMKSSICISQTFNILKLINILWKIMPDLNATSKLFWLHCDMVRLATFLVTYINF